jgi:hypothetical protein
VLAKRNKGFRFAYLKEQKASIPLATGISYRLMNRPGRAMLNYKSADQAAGRLETHLCKHHHGNGLAQSTLAKPDARLMGSDATE